MTKTTRPAHAYGGGYKTREAAERELTSARVRHQLGDTSGWHVVEVKGLARPFFIVRKNPDDVQPDRRRIAQLIREGKPRDVALAIAYREARARAAKNPSSAPPSRRARTELKSTELRALAAVRYGWTLTPAERRAAYDVLIRHGFIDASAATWKLTAKGEAVLNASLRRENPEPLDYPAVHGGRQGDFREKRVKIPDPRAGRLVVLGRLHRLEYITDKGNGVSVYFHTLGRRVEGGREDERSRPSENRQPWLVFNRTGLFVAGGHYEVRPEGIVG